MSDKVSRDIEDLERLQHHLEQEHSERVREKQKLEAEQAIKRAQAVTKWSTFGPILEALANEYEKHHQKLHIETIFLHASDQYGSPTYKVRFAFSRQGYNNSACELNFYLDEASNPIYTDRPGVRTAFDPNKETAEKLFHSSCSELLKAMYS